MAAGSVHIPWYATLFRGDQLAEALKEIAPLAIRYGATSYSVYRSRDDQYKFIHAVEFENKLDWERYWNGPEFSDWRAKYTSWYQVPVLYVWHDIVSAGATELVEG
jgi:hypothetical protein